MKDKLQAAAEQTHYDSLAFLKVHEIFSALGENESFKDLFAEKIFQVYESSNISECLEKIN